MVDGGWRVVSGVWWAVGREWWVVRGGRRDVSSERFLVEFYWQTSVSRSGRSAWRYEVHDPVGSLPFYSSDALD